MTRSHTHIVNPITIYRMGNTTKRISNRNSKQAAAEPIPNREERFDRLCPLKDINPAEKGLLMKIWEKSGGGCKATNKQLGEWVGIPCRSISRLIPSLIDKGYLTAESPDSRNRVLFGTEQLANIPNL